MRILASNQMFRAKTVQNEEKNNDYVDPLMKWPIRGAAFTNEVGEGLRPLIGGYATLSWVPALLYFGADIYDKYKNEGTEYNPDKTRGVKQAIFQGMASVFLPLLAVKSGQNLFSEFGRLMNNKITINSEEQVSKIAKEFIANGKLHAYEGKDSECVKEFLDNVENTIDFNKQEHAAKNPLKKFKYFVEDKIYKVLKLDNKENIRNFSKSTIEELIQTRKDVLASSDSIKTSNVFKSFLAGLESGETKNVAVKSALIQMQDRKMLKGNFIKTIGGFVALGLAIKPIDNFVEHTLIEKWLAPVLDKPNMD